MIRRTACCLCLSLLLGILYAKGGEWWVPAVFLLMTAYMAAAILRLRENAWPAACVRTLLCICLFGAGFVHMQSQQAVRGRLEAVLADGDNITVQGEVMRKVEKAVQEKEAFEQTQFIYYLTDTRVFLGDKSYPSYGILIYSQDGRYQPGNHLQVTGSYAAFQISRNEGNFNEKQYQQSRKWEFKVYADSVTLLSSHSNQYIVFLAELRQRMQKVFAESLEAEDAGVMANMALGEKSLMDAEIKDLYRDAGISHVLAISGLHVSILGMGIFALLQRLGCPGKWSACICAGVVCSFGIFSGMETSTVRAVLMFLLLMVAHMCGRTYDSLTALSLSAAVQLWENPFLLWYAGFLFSYGAVLGVIVVWKTIKEAGKERLEDGQREQERRNRTFWQKKVIALKDMFCVSASIQLVTLPISVYFYYEIPPYSVLTNVCILPFMGVLLSLGILGGILGSIFPLLGAVVLKPASWLLAFYNLVCRVSGKLPWASLIIGRPSFWLVIIYYAILVICLYFVWRLHKKRYLAGIILVLVCLLFARGKSQFEIDVLDVGQGDGIFIQNDNGECFFVDGGSSNVKGVGKYRILPFLKSHGIRAVRGWIVSHGDADHISGLLEVLQQGYQVENLILSSCMVRDEAWESLLREAEGAGCNVLYVSPGMQFGSGDLMFTVLAPDGGGTGNHAGNSEVRTGSGAGNSQAGADDGEGNRADRNALSLSFLLEYQGFSGVFTGDIGAEQERELLMKGCLQQYGIREVDFYKAAHHGSNHSNSGEFLKGISPRMTAVSCAEKNSYGHPGKEAVARMRDAGSWVFFTMEQGQICIRKEEEGVRVWTYLP